MNCDDALYGTSEANTASNKSVEFGQFQILITEPSNVTELISDTTNSLLTDSQPNGHLFDHELCISMITCISDECTKSVNYPESASTKLVEQTSRA